MSHRWLQALLIPVLGLLFFAPLVLHPTQVLYSDHSDLLAEHLPAKRFLVHSLHETGELPLWCPYTFGGSPFVHDIQVGMFYPPNAILYLLPENYVGPGLSWLIVLHVLIAGWCMLVYAWSQGLDGWPAVVAAAGFMFAGRWLLHILGGGFYVLVALAWLPLVLLLLETAIRRASVVWATAAGAVFALIALNTHPQFTFYSGIFLALWSFGAARDRAGNFADDKSARSARRTLSACGVWAGCGAWAAIVAIGVSVVQLLPTLEAAAYSSRSAGVETAQAQSGGLQALLFFFGPTLTPEPFNAQWEDRGGFGVLWVFLAVLAPLLGRGRVRFQASICALLLLFALGGSALVQGLPGFRLFRQPARMLVVAGMPVALLAGIAMQSLLALAKDDLQTRRRCRGVLVRVTVVAAILCGGYALRRGLWEKETVAFHVYWLTLLVTIPVSWALLSMRRAGAAWMLVLVADLWGLAWPLVSVRPAAEIYEPSQSIATILRSGDPRARVLDEDPIDRAGGSPLGSGAPLALWWRIEAVRGYNPLDVLRYKEYLQFIADRDGALRPFEGDLTFPAIRNVQVADKPLLDLLGVRYLLRPAELPPADGKGWRLVAVDNYPSAYDFVSGGRRSLGPFALYENRGALPRAFVAPRARPLPDCSSMLPALKETNFQELVWLEGCPPDWSQDESSAPSSKAAEARITEYQPNHIVVDVHADAPGYLVLTDLWYPGWRCQIDEGAAPLFRADYLFRATPIPAGAHQVTFDFRPDSYRYGKAISLAALLATGGIFAGGLFVRFRCKCGGKQATLSEHVGQPNQVNLLGAGQAAKLDLPFDRP